MKKIVSFLIALGLVTSSATGIGWRESHRTAVHAAVTLTGEQVAEYANSLVGSSYPANYCLAFVRQVFMDLKGDPSSSCCAWNYAQTYMTHTTEDEIPLGADVFFSSTGCRYNVKDSYGHDCGHIGIYVGNGEIVHAYGGQIKRMKIETVVSHGYTYIGWGFHGGVNIIGNEDTCHCTDEYRGTYVTTENLFLRCGHGTNFNSIVVIPQGSEVYVEKGNGTWGHVLYNGNAGYSHMGYLTKKSDPVSSMYIENQHIPDGFHEYRKCFPITGKIHSSSLITYVECGAYNLDGTPVPGVHATAAPYSYEYNLEEMDNNIIFNDLEEYYYIYKAVAYDETGNNYVFGEKIFRNGNAQCPGHVFDEKVVVDSDCIHSGNATETCKICGYIHEEEIPQKEHNWKELRIEESCTEPGAIERTCLTCGVTESEIVDAKGHEYTETAVVPATLDSEGYTIYQCTHCGDSYNDNYTSKLTVGDLNSDGKSDLTDLTELSLFLVGDKKFTDSQKSLADFDNDGEVSLADLARFRQFVSKQITSL